jgi:hypothetical protein
MNSNSTIESTATRFDVDTGDAARMPSGRWATGRDW